MSIVKAKIRPLNNRCLAILSFKGTDSNYNERIIFETKQEALSKLKHWYHYKGKIEE